MYVAYTIRKWGWGFRDFLNETNSGKAMIVAIIQEEIIQEEKAYKKG